VEAKVPEQPGSDVVASADSRVALNPGTAPEVLAGIAQRRPELRVFVAMNPSTYPALVQWLAQLGDPAVNAALAGRFPAVIEPSAVLPHPPAPPFTSAVPSGVARHRRAVIAVVLVGVLAMAGGGFVGYRILTGGTREPAAAWTPTIPVGTGPTGVTSSATAPTLIDLNAHGVGTVEFGTSDALPQLTALLGARDIGRDQTWEECGMPFIRSLQWGGLRVDLNDGALWGWSVDGTDLPIGVTVPYGVGPGQPLAKILAYPEASKPEPSILDPTNSYTQLAGVWWVAEGYDPSSVILVVGKNFAVCD
jgi:hypothetical protein